MEEQPLVTVVIPTWNRLPLVEEAVASVIAQTYRRWELIVIDDGSTDGTADRLTALRDPRIRVLSAPRVGHLGHVRNRGAVTGSGEYIAFLDLDDLWRPEKLEAQLAALQASGAGWSYSRFELMDADARAMPLNPAPLWLVSGDIFEDLLAFKPTIYTSTLMVGRKLFEAVGGFSEDSRLYYLGEDYELYMRLGLHASAVAVPDGLVRIRKHGGNTSAERNNDSPALMARIYEVILEHPLAPKHSRLARRLWTRSLADAGARQLSIGNVRQSVLLFSRSAINGAHPKDWMRALARGVRDGLFRQRASLKRNA